MRRGDERAVTVQVGAVLLLGILLTALAIYQVNVVPAENQEVEFNHNQQVQGELQDLRNSIQNVGTNGGSQSTSITLGTQYPTRSFTVNPTNPTGSLETSGSETIELRGFDDQGLDPNDFDGNPRTLFDEQLNTTTVGYTPNYNEYSDPPATRIEHGFTYNQFQESEIGLTQQSLIDNNSIRLVLVDGDLSETSGSTVSLDITNKSGPTDPIEITTEDDGGELEFPTQAPDVWNETLDGQPNVDVTNTEFDGDSLTVPLNDGTYEVTATCVTIEGGDGNCEDLDITRDTGDSPEGGDTSTFPGPKVTELDLMDDQEDNDEVEIDSTISTLGDQVNRSGVPIQYAEWYLEGPDESDSGQGEEEEFDSINVETNPQVFEEVSDTIDTSSLEEGEEYRVFVRAQDARGIWNETKEGEPFIVEEDESGDPGEPAEGSIIADQIDDLAEGESDQEQTFRFELTEERLDNEETVTIDLSEPNAAGVGYDDAEVDSPTGEQSDPEATFEEGGDELVFEAQTGNVNADVYEIEVSAINVNDDTAQEFENIVFTRDDTDDTDTGSFEITERPQTDPENTVVLEDDGETFDVIEETNESDVVFEGRNSEFLVQAGDDDPADMQGVVVFDEDNGKVTVDSSDDEIATSQEIFMRNSSEVDLSGSDDEEARVEDDITLGDDSTLTADASRVTGDISIGADNSEIEIDAGDDVESVVTGTVETEDDATIDLIGSDDEEVRIEDDVTMEDGASLTLDGAQIEGDTNVGTDSSIEVRAEDDYPSEITGSVGVGDNSDVLLEASSDEEAILNSDLTYDGGGTIELIDSSDEDAQINGQVVIEDEDSTVTFALENEDRFNDLDVVDGDGEELTEDNDQVEITT